MPSIGSALVATLPENAETDGAIARVLIVDDHPMIRQIVDFACKEHPRLETAGEASSGEEALLMMRRLRPDVVVLDMMMPGMSGIETVRELIKEDPDCKIVMLSAQADERSICDSMIAGARGFIVKTAPMDEVAKAIDVVARGGNAMSEPTKLSAYRRLREMADEAREAARVENTLTPREREVLDLIVEGLTARQMARRMSVSERTAETHIANLYRKLEVRSRVQAVSRAVELRLVSLG